MPLTADVVCATTTSRGPRIGHLVEHRQVHVVERVAARVVARIVGGAGLTAVDLGLVAVLMSSAPVNRPPAGIPTAMNGP